jgi:hypothetical protein
MTIGPQLKAYRKQGHALSVRVTELLRRLDNCFDDRGCADLGKLAGVVGEVRSTRLALDEWLRSAPRRDRGTTPQSRSPRGRL